MGPRAKAGHEQILLRTVSCLAFLLWLGWASLPDVVEAQARGRTFQIGQGDSRTERFRQQREDLDRQHKEQEQRQRQLSEKNEELLRQQTQVQRTIPLVEQELKRPLSPADYTAKKCELQELTEKQQQIEQQFKANQGELARIEQNRMRLQEQLERIQQDVARVREQPVPTTRPARRVPRQPQQEPAWEQAWQQQMAQAWQQQAQARAEAQRVPDRLTRIMNSQANPFTGIPSDLLQARRLTWSAAPPFATLRVSSPVTYVATDAQLFFEIPIGAQLTAAEANSARRILVTFAVSGDTLDQGFRFGLKGSPPVTRYFSGSPTFPAGSAANGLHTFQLTTGQFTTSVTDFVLGFSNTPSIGTEITVSQMRVDFYR
ncbi:MAG: hypothetical protein HY914_15625 [Desulfomonile tiedjei]|nr:hypothetical protein [Desulfomonile tiedjei]